MSIGGGGARGCRGWRAACPGPAAAGGAAGVCAGAAVTIKPVAPRAPAVKLPGMSATPLHEIVPVLQTAIGPVILISGVGLLLLTMTNRLGRAIDRARALVRELRAGPEADQAATRAQVVIIYRRARLIRLSIALASLSVLFAALLVIGLFLGAVLKWDQGLAVSLIFMACMGSLIASLVAFLYDIHLSLVALRLELQHAGPQLV
jgi:hypothetical protein